MTHNNKEYGKTLEDYKKIGPGEYLKESHDYSFEKSMNMVDYASLKHLHNSRKKDHSIDMS
jgi:hypothetical protein